MDDARREALKVDFVQGFTAYCGFEAVAIEEGRFSSRIRLASWHRQQDGFAHAGVIATLADHSGGYAAYTVVDEGFRILTIEFKINFYRPARGEWLRCQAHVLHRGRKIIVSESDVFSEEDGGLQKRVSRATVTLMAVPVEKFQ